MQFTILRQNLKSALDNVRTTVRTNPHVEWSKMLKFHISPVESSITAYDLDTGIISTIDVSTMESAEFLVEPDKLSALVSKLTDDMVSFDLDWNAMTLTIKCGRSKSKVLVQSADNFPCIPDADSQTSITMSCAEFAEAVRQTVFAVAQNDNKPVLKGELFEVADSTLTVSAIDGYRLAVKKTAVSTADNYRLIIKGDTLKAVAKLAKDGVIILYPSRKHVVFGLGRNKIFTRLLEGEFVDYRRTVDAPHTSEAVVNTSDLIEVLDRFTLMTDSKAKAPARCVFGSGKIDLSIKSAHGEMSDCIDIDYSGPEVTIGINVYFLLDALKASESDKVKLQLNGGLSPMKILPLDGNSYVFVVLPVRLKD